MTQPQRPRAVNVVVATTVMLSFISFWRAAAIVLSDLASSAYYVGGIAEQAIGKAAPWFILAIMLFSYAVRAIYIESCSMFVRGGVYKVVHEAMGGTLAKFSVSALMFDYVLTGPISGVSAGLYLGGLINETGEYLHISGLRVHPPYFAAVFAAVVTVYFWRKNIIGIHESSEKALQIMQITTVMVVILIAWCLVTIFKNGYQPVPLPIPANLHFSNEALGWLRGTVGPSITVIAVLIGLGHSLLAMSGEESLAQVNREIAHPKLKNLERAGFVIFIYSMVFTSLVSFFAVMIIPDAARPKFLDNLIGGLSMFLVGPVSVRLLFHAFVVLVGTLILAGAVNTAIIGSNGVLNRVAEDGVLPDWFRHPHHKYGTSSRLINLIVILQLITILISRGDVYMLGEAYAFGVVWSFAMKALSVLVLRYKQPQGRGWKVPFNFHIGRTEAPVGLFLITIALFALAIINVVTKRVATISGVSFTIAFFIVFEISEKYNRRHTAAHSQEMEKFNLNTEEELSADAAHVRPGNVIVAVRNPNRLEHLQRILEKTDTRRIDVVVLSVRQVTQAGSGEHALEVSQIFSVDETEVFTKVVNLAEKAGKHVELMVVPGGNPYAAIIQAAQRLQSSRIVMGLSPKLSPAEQGATVGREWENLPEPRPSLSLEIVVPGEEESIFYNLGPHPPRLWPQDLDLLHRLWLELSTKGPGAKLHHRDVVGVALRRLEQELQSGRVDDVVADVMREVTNGSAKPPLN
ncbi:MAG: APC family permease [Bryobacteraceae bacterium]|jgi:amino acid transporter/nucleotide-binding universal stress UspA family protein